MSIVYCSHDVILKDKDGYFCANCGERVGISSI